MKYLVEMTFVVVAETHQEAVIQGLGIADKINKTMDNSCEVDRITMIDRSNPKDVYTRINKSDVPEL